MSKPESANRHSHVKTTATLRQHSAVFALGCLSLFALLTTSCTRVTQAPLEERIITPGSLAVVGELKPESLDDTPKKARPSATPAPTPSVSPIPTVPAVNSKPIRIKATPTPTPRATPIPSPTPSPKPLGSLHGRVNIVDESGQVLDTQGMILRLSPADGSKLEHARAAKTHAMDMKDKTYLPRYLTIQKNDRVSFVNRDEIKHNVFSSTGKNAFDLGTYAGGLKREVSLHAEGIVKVYCNIHAEMASFIAVTDGDVATVATPDGHFSFEDIPPGDYQLHVWHIRGESTEHVRIDEGKRSDVAITLRSATQVDLNHKNKFGKSYTTNATFFDDEFY